MPYAIKVTGSDSRPFKIVRKTDGKVVGTSTSLKNAKASIRARYAREKK